ncbi:MULTISPECIES: VPS10 domain-containing protein [unclassified Arenibacter]|uniref:WD40/YVTN/BNR-like repeat-containing protein n=1 Tax=unclassified Arenibacter TaxID=2615047 RepID=UPI000E34866D|nr:MULTISPECIES: oxidoreductase [unclassified Arenibacter]MCM4163255.1 oxidoreductase [Arenibacter sp. A80]RFT57271.1 oxidoreductase [Arenibacter sp. P308M17]
MRNYLAILMLSILGACSEMEEGRTFNTVKIENIYTDSLSFRAIQIMDGGNIAFAANKGAFGLLDLGFSKVRVNTQKYDSILPEFRAVAQNSTDFFMLSIGNPALLYKTGGKGNMELVYREGGEGVFYDAMTFWNEQEGIAVGDSLDGCLSIIITRDGGNTWKKIPCSSLPKSETGEGAFVASNTNIKTLGTKAWIATTHGNVYITYDKGFTWEVIKTPITSEKPTQGIFSIDFYDENTGIVFGGDYTDPKNNKGNKAVTMDGGRTWKLIANGKLPNYRSCVQFVPNSMGKSLIAIGFEGVAYSFDSGETWKQLSNESFYTLRFMNDSIAYAAGKDRIAKLIFR